MSTTDIRLISLFLAATVSSMLVAASMDTDARRGAEFFKTQGCVACHGVKGVGEGKAPDLGKRLDRNYTPAGIAAQMWSHAPIMWANMSKDSVPVPQFTTAQAGDLFAYFYSARYFEKPGEAERGKRLFQSKHCSECHATTAGSKSVGPPVERWESLAAPIVLIEHMWNHQALMKGAMADRHITWPRLTSQELTDMLVYLQNLPQTRNADLFLVLPNPDEGAGLFVEKGCAECHKDALAMESRLGDSTLTDVAAAMWNHAPQMREPPPQLTIVEWRRLISYVWAKQFFANRGDAARGHKTFAAKKCASCHDDRSSGAPALSKPAEPYSAMTMVSVLWKHGPAMLRKMEDKHIAWPQLSQVEMSNLIAYLNSR